MAVLRYKKSKCRLFILFGIAFILTLVFMARRNGNQLVSKSESKIHKKHESRNVTVNIPRDLDIFVQQRIYTVPEMKMEAAKLNFIQHVNNVDVFGNHTANSPVIIIQVHDRPDALKLVFNSLKYVKGIENVTLVISRDKFSPAMDSLIDKYIDFCRYIEIFFPYSMQLNPDKFPGEDPNDCSRDLSKDKAISIGCNNAEFPDMYGHYREVKYVQIKHHWFWKLNMVFSGIKVLKNQKAPMLFIEDDHFVAPDIINMMKLTTELKESKCPHCNIISLGTYESMTNYNTYGGQVNVLAWESSKHNMGMVLDKKFYDDLLEKSKEFCSYDDYNWDWSLQYVGSTVFKTGIHTMFIKTPHVMHMGCNGFHKSSNCVIESLYDKFNNLMKEQNSYLFPKTLSIVSDNQSKKRPGSPNGGWGDIRDQSLCQKYKELCLEITS